MSTALPFQGQYWARIGLKTWIMSPTPQSVRGAPRVWGMCLDQMDGRYAVRRVVPHFFAPAPAPPPDGSVNQEDKGNRKDMVEMKGAMKNPLTPITSRRVIKIRPEPHYHPAGSADSPAPAYDLHDRVRAACGDLAPLRQALANFARNNKQPSSGPQQIGGEQKEGEALAKALGLYVEPVPHPASTNVGDSTEDEMQNKDKDAGAIASNGQAAKSPVDRENVASPKPKNKVKKRVAFAETAQLRIFHRVRRTDPPRPTASLRDPGMPSARPSTSTLDNGSTHIPLGTRRPMRPYVRPDDLETDSISANSVADVSNILRTTNLNNDSGAESGTDDIFDKYLRAIRSGTLSRSERSALLQGIVASGNASDAWTAAASAASVAAAASPSAVRVADLMGRRVRTE